MNKLKLKRAQYIQKILARLYPNPSIPLKHKDEFTLLVAVVLSARCTDKKVNQVTPQLFELADNPKDMANLDPKQIQQIIRPCGLSPTKSKALVNLSKQILEKYHGKVPKTFEELEELPGVGHKTASVVMVQAFKIPAFPVDTHIYRLAHRWRLSSGKSVAQVEKDLKDLFSKNAWAKLHLQMIYYGREHCTARGCNGKKCIICKVVNQNVPI